MSGSENCNFVYSVFYTVETQMYGISCSDEKGNKVGSIDDIAEQMNIVDEFCAMLNSAQIHPYHFCDVYEDYFG